MFKEEFVYFELVQTNNNYEFMRKKMKQDISSSFNILREWNLDVDSEIMMMFLG